MPGSRTRLRYTTTGRMWWAREYFATDGAWTPDSRKALLFPAGPPRDLVHQLIADHPGRPAFGPINSVYARVDGHVPVGSLPPRELWRDDR